MNGPKQTLEELKKIYPVESIAPYGIVLIIPANEYNRDEIADLKEENKAIYTSYNNKGVVFIKLPPKETQPPAVGFEPTTPKPEPAAANRTDEWTQPEIDLLIDLYEKETDLGTIIKEFQKADPTRTSNAIRVKASKLFLKLKEPKTKIIQTRSAVGGDQWKNVWQPEEDETLIALWNQEPHLTVQQITDIFAKKHNTNRTLNAVGNRLSGLQKEKRIQPRWRIKDHKKPEPKVPSKPKHGNEEKEESVAAKTNDDGAIKIEQKTEEPAAFKTIIEAYDTLKQAYTELKKDLTSVNAYVETNLGQCVEDIVKLKKQFEFIAGNYATNEELQTLTAMLQDHKHAKGSGEAMLPMKVQK